MAKRKVATETPPDEPVAEAWLLCEFDPVSLFSLRMTHSTSKGGKTLLVPTPYAFKLALIDACFRCFPASQAAGEASRMFDIVKRRSVRFQPPESCVVQNTFVKIRQEERDAENGFYTSTIAYREWVYYRGRLTVAIQVGGTTEDERDFIQATAMHINYLGKRGCFWQFIGSGEREGELPPGFTLHGNNFASLRPEIYGVSQFLDDFGEPLCKAKDGFERVSTYHSGKITLGEHRVLVPTLIPYRRIKAARSFTQYRCEI